MNCAVKLLVIFRPLYKIDACITGVEIACVRATTPPHEMSAKQAMRAPAIDRKCFMACVCSQICGGLRAPNRLKSPFQQTVSMPHDSSSLFNMIQRKASYGDHTIQVNLAEIVYCGTTILSDGELVD